MDVELFSGRSILTMVHGIVLGGGALVGIAVALFGMVALRPADGAEPSAGPQARNLAWLLIATAVVLWLTVIAGTYVSFPPYRATPPEGLTDLSDFPRSLIQSNPDTRWLHSFAMEIKEHMPWIAAMLVTAAAFITARYRTQLFGDASLRRAAAVLLAISLALVAGVSLLGVFINKVAPLD